MDSQVRAFLDAMALAGRPSIASLPPVEGRAMFNELVGSDIVLSTVELEQVEDKETRDGVAFRIYRPETPAEEELLPVVLYLHGGGWVVGNVATHDTLCRHLARAGKVVVVSAEYRLAPEHPFPLPLEDCHSVLQHLAEHGASMGIDSGRLAVAGDSAGGNLAAALAIKARDEKGPPIQLQLLIYPVTDAACDSRSYGEFGADHGLTKEEMQWFWRCYLGELEGSSCPLASIANSPDLRGLPPAWILTAEYDVLRDEGEAYAKQLESAGVDVKLKRVDGVIHGFFHCGGVIDRGREAVLESGQWLGEKLRN